jgi:hypothetical protein
MNTPPSKVIATRGSSICHSPHATLIHHSDFPEIWAEGSTLVDAATQLVRMLSNALEGSTSNWQRDVLVRAIEEVNEFISTQTRNQPRMNLVITQ